MSEPVTEKLSRFTPDGTGLDRDALLFAAGRASARPNRTWIAAAGALAASQLLTLALLWPPAATEVGAPAVVVITSPAVVATPTVEERDLSPSPSGSSLWALRQEFLEGGPNARPAATGPDIAPVSPPLRAFPISEDIFAN